MNSSKILRLDDGCLIFNLSPFRRGGVRGVVIPNYYSIILVKYYKNTLFNSLILLTILFLERERERERERESNKVKTHMKC